MPHVGCVDALKFLGNFATMCVLQLYSTCRLFSNKLTCRITCEHLSQNFQFVNVFCFKLFCVCADHFGDLSTTCVSQCVCLATCTAVEYNTQGRVVQSPIKLIQD